jgi:hypothetical protein
MIIELCFYRRRLAVFNHHFMSQPLKIISVLSEARLQRFLNSNVRLDVRQLVSLGTYCKGEKRIGGRELCPGPLCECCIRVENSGL